MKKDQHLTVIICLFIIGALLTACGIKNERDAQKQADAKEAAMGEQMGDEDTEASSDFTIVPVFLNGNEEGDKKPAFLCGHFREYHEISYAIRDSSGNLMQFDNDADYSVFCPIISFIEDATALAAINYMEDLCGKYDIERNSIMRNYKEFKDFLKNKGKVNNMNKEIATFWESSIDGVEKYVNGDKDKISDPKIFKMVDKAYYDTHPNEHYYVEYESKYNFKEYRRDDGRRTVYATPNEPSDLTLDWILSDGTIVPSNVLILD